MKITLIHPSRGRAQKAYNTLNRWMIMASGKHEIEHILSLDADDPQKDNYINRFPNATKYCIENNTCVVEATNNAAKHATGDILIYLSDDFNCPMHWDHLIFIRVFLKELSPKNNWLLKVNDNLQPFEVMVLTIPIMSIGLYNFLGYFWHPEYKSMFVDEDLYHTCVKLDCMIMAPELVFPHEHPSNGKAENDETYIRSAANWDIGKAKFAERKGAGFPLVNEGHGSPIEVTEINNHQTDFYKSNK